MHPRLDRAGRFLLPDCLSQRARPHQRSREKWLFGIKLIDIETGIGQTQFDHSLWLDHKPEDVSSRAPNPVTLTSFCTPAFFISDSSTRVASEARVTGFRTGDSNASINMLQRLPFNMLLKRAYDDKSAQEELIEASDLDWLIVRPGVLTNGSASGKYRVLTKPAYWCNGIISRADVADFIVQRIEAGADLPGIIRIARLGGHDHAR